MEVQENAPLRDEAGRFAAQPDNGPTPIADDVDPAPVEPVAEPAPGAEPAPAEAAAEPDAAAASEPTPEPDAEEAAFLHDAPRELRDVWGSLTPEQRPGIKAAFGTYTRKLAEAGRTKQALAPIEQVLHRAAAELPQVAHMTPGQLAAEIFEFAKIQARLTTDPVSAIWEVAQRYGATEGLRARLGGQETPAAASWEQKFVQLERQFRDATDPNRIYEAVTQRQQQDQTMTLLEQFAGEHKHFAAVESDLPLFVQAVRNMNTSASPRDTLEQAYNLAVTAKGLAPVTAPAPLHAPARTAEAVKARSVNTPSQGVGKVKERSIEEDVEAIFARIGM